MRRQLLTLSYYLLTLSPVFSQSVIRTLAWELDTARPALQEWALVRGETVDIECRYLAGASAMDVRGATVVLHARTNGMPADLSFQVTGRVGRVSSTNLAAVGWVTVRLRPDLDLPHDVTRCTFSLDTSLDAARNLVATGLLRLSGDPTGVTPMALAAGVYDARGSAQTVSNALAAALQYALTSSIPAQIANATPAVLAAAALATSQTVALAISNLPPSGLSAVTVTGIVTAAVSNSLASLPPAPTGVPVWIGTDGSDFATVEPGPVFVAWNRTQAGWHATPEAEGIDTSVLPFPLALGEYGLFIVLRNPDDTFGIYYGSDWRKDSVDDFSITNFTLLNVNDQRGVDVHYRRAATNYVTRLATTNDLSLLLTTASLEEWWDTKQAIINNQSFLSALRLATPDGSRWIDATGAVWTVTVAPATTTNMSLSPGFGYVNANSDFVAPSQSQYTLPFVDGDWQGYIVNSATGEYGVYQSVDGMEWRNSDYAGNVLDLTNLTGWAGAYTHVGYATVSIQAVGTAVTSRVDTVALLSDIAGLSSAWTNSLLYASNGTNYYPRWDSALQTYVVMGVPQ
jgi:hypothetical protein